MQWFIYKKFCYCARVLVESCTMLQGKDKIKLTQGSINYSLLISLLMASDTF